jgi:hypothetical protein
VKVALAVAAALVAALAVLLIALTGRTVVEHPAYAIGAPAGAAIAIDGDPVGLSVEYQLLAHWLGSGRCPPAALVRAIRVLGSPTIRIGGDSQEQTAPAGSAPHAGVSDLPVAFWARVGCLERETSVPIVVGLNLASGVPGWAATLADQARAVIAAPRLRFELANEPDIYGSHVPWWNGTRLVHAPMAFATYLSRARAIAAAIGPGAFIEGPDFASGRWVRAVPALIPALHLKALDAHFYPLDACRTSAGANAGALLSRATQLKLDERVRIARDARAAGLEAVISETNSISCGGVAGVSDSPAAAVWAARLVLEALRAGFTSVRFHSSDGAYDPFTVHGGVVTTRPLELGLRAAAALLPAGARLRPIPSARPFDAVAVSTAATVTYLLNNYGPASRPVAVPARGSVAVEAIVARAPTVLRWKAGPSGGRARVVLPPNSLTAITTASG